MSDRINILRVITWLPVGGIERRLVATLPRLDRERFSVSLVCIRQRGPLADELEAAGIPVELIPFRRRWDIRALRQLAALMRRRRIDVVHSHMYRSNVPATVAGRFARVPQIWGQVHNVGTWETRRQRQIDRALCRFRSGMIAVSDRVQQDVMENLGLSAERVKVIHNGVDLARFQAARAQRESVRKSEGAGPEDMVFVFAARMVEQKRAGDFLQAIGMLQSQPEGERIRAWMLGDGPLRGKLEADAALLPFPKHIRFMGQRDDVENYLAASDAFVLPSMKEGFSNGLVEALAAGLPAVATDVGGNAEAVRDHVDGFIVPPRAPHALEQAMSLLWRKPTLRATMAASAAERAASFSLNAMVAELEEFYAGLPLPRRHAGAATLEQETR